MAEKLLDVSDLEPPEPFEQALAALAELSEGDYLRLLHRREPFPLYDILEQQGYTWHTRPGQTTEVEILIWRKADGAAGAAIRQAQN